MKILRPQYEEAYRLAKEVYAGRMRLTDAQNRLEEIGLNRNSAADLIYDFKHLLDGEGYERKLSVAVTDDYLSWIRRDFGEEKLSNAISALRQHIEYYSSLAKTPMRAHRVVLAKYEASVETGDGFVTYPDEIPSSAKNTEGKVKAVLVNIYERSRTARNACVQAHGTTCAVCEFDFGAIYGLLGQDFIHVHHLLDLASVGKEYEIDPVKDLIPVCPNCHAMLHRKKIPARSIADLKEQIAAQKQKRGTN